MEDALFKDPRLQRSAFAEYQRMGEGPITYSIKL